MKKVAIVAVILVASLSAFQVSAQKFGYVDMQEIISNMPETAKADTALTNYRQDLYEQIQNMQKEFQDNANKFITDSATLSDAVKEVKRDELRDQQNRLMNFQQTSSQKVQQKNQELLDPIIKKAQGAVTEVAKAKGYTWVFNDSGDGVLMVKPDGDDLTAAVKAKLGISK